MKLSRLLPVLLLIGSAPALHAQAVPFGKNKIQYRDFDWRVLAGEHIDVFYYPEEETLARLTLAYAEESFELLERRFQHHPFRRIPLIVYSSHHHFEQTNIFPGFIPEGVLGFTEYLKRRVALPFRGDYAQFRHTLRHELVHAFQISKLAEVHSMHPRRNQFSPQAIHWFTEGLAEFWSSEQTTEDEMFIRDMVVNGRLPDIRRFNSLYSYASYPLGAELHRYLAERFGEQWVVELYETYWKYPTFEAALEAILGTDLDRLSREWKYALEQRHFPAYAERPPLPVRAHPVIHRGGGNYKPTLYTAPGDSIPTLVFLSPRNGYTNIYRTRLDRGEEGLETVVEGERTAQFESFHASDSRMDIDERGILAFVSRYLDTDALFLWDLAAGRVVGRYQWDDLVGLKSPSWSPGGDALVFEGLSEQGFSDLYILDLRTRQRRALTSDRYRDADPDWSPDGRSIVFASDRTDGGELGHVNLFLLDVASGSIRFLTYGPWVDQQPRWSHDGSRIAFTSDRSGSIDLYQVDVHGSGRQLSAMTGGAFDPVWLPGDAGLVFAGFHNGAFGIYRFDFAGDTAALPTVALEFPPQRPLAAAPAGGAADGSVGWAWSDLQAPVLRTAKSKRYDALREITLDFAGGDAVFAPGLGTAQGAQFLATDMLGNHIVFLGISALQASDLSDLVDSFNGQLVYLNLSHRLNYGAGIFRLNGRFYDVALDIFEEETLGAQFLASYPFSKYQRVEYHLALEQSDRRDVPDFRDLPPGFGASGDTRDLTRKGFLASNFLSFVRDNTLWLPTGPIDGERLNLTAGVVSCFDCTTASPVTGTPVHRGTIAENYVLFADYRRYFRTSLYSAYAVRAYGYLSDGAIPGRTVLGGTSRLRGYPRYSLAGSRVLLLNQEWRFPLLHGLALAFPFGELRFPGIQGGLFADLGSSWLEDEKPRGAWGSYGLGLRMSLGSPLVLRLDIGRRFRMGDEPPVVFRGGDDFSDTFIDFFFGFNY